MDGLTREQRRLHLAGKMLWEFCAGGGGGGGSGTITSGAELSGASLMRCGAAGPAALQRGHPCLLACLTD